MAKNANTRRSADTGSPPPSGRSGRGFFRTLFAWFFAAGLLVVLVVGAAVAFTAQGLPTYDQIKSTQQGQMILVRARDGTELFNMGPSYGKWVPIAQIPQVMQSAMISVEDRRFHEHFGVDPIGIVRSLFVRVQSGHWRQGGSTITQQLARNLFLNNSKSFSRKINEAVYSMAIETKFTKQQILELYLNKVYFGGGAYGVDAASRKFFGHPAAELSLPEAAIIAGLVKAPSHYSPTADKQAAVDRAKVVLQTMQDAGALATYQVAAVDLSKVQFAPEGEQNAVRYFTDWALPQLDLLVPDNNEPIEVWTTLDVTMQREAALAVQGNAPKGAQGALVSMDRDGGILAMVGGTDYVTSNYNRATLSKRQPGSAFKLFVYLAALEAGYKPDDSVVDEPVTIDGWSPKNSHGDYAGQIDVRTAFAYSKNTVAAQLGNEVGFSTVAAMARRFGITTPVNTMPSMVLGTSDVHLFDLTRAFAAVSAHGTSVEPYGISKIVTMDGRVLYQHPASTGQQLVPPFVSAAITDLLQTAVNIGTGKAAQIGRPVAGKTGTTSSNKDGWFMGFSSGITTGVWMGRDDAKPVPGLAGGTAPARAFAQYMRVAVAKRPIEPFDTQLTLPPWQLEPDDEAIAANPSDYFYVDDQGNLVDPTHAKPVPADKPADRRDVPSAVTADFLDQATGRKTPAKPRNPVARVPAN
ncbi:MAG: hypothetical protein RLZZ136_1148 [Pseudomonadota bacterium]